jgi:hypothetical protein
MAGHLRFNVMTMQLLTTRRDTRPPLDGAPGGTDANGGFPLPPAGDPVRVVRCRHEACGAETRVMLPAALPDSAVQRVVCDSCRQPYDPAADGGLAGAAVRRTPPAIAALLARLANRRDSVADRVSGAGLPQLPKIAKSRLWAWASVPLAALGVVAGLSLIQGYSSPPATNGTPPPAAGQAEARFLEGSGYSLALPAGWTREDPPEGAAFAAESKDGLADVTLWIEDEPGLSFSEFEARSLEQLSEVGENARISQRIEGPTVESTIIELRAEAPVAEGAAAELRVTLRGAGDYRFYLSTAVQPGAAAGTSAAIETLHASLRPEVSVAGLDEDAG